VYLQKVIPGGIFIISWWWRHSLGADLIGSGLDGENFFPLVISLGNAWDPQNQKFGKNPFQVAINYSSDSEWNFCPCC